MRFRSSHVLTILLLLAAACPPPRVSAFLLHSGPHRDAMHGAKPPRVRGRNRVPSPPRLDVAAVEGRLGSGDNRRRAPDPDAFRERPDAGRDAHSLRSTTSLAIALPAAFRLRC